MSAAPGFGDQQDRTNASIAALSNAVPQRQSFAAELHDSIAQSLAAVNLMLQGLIEQPSYPASETRAMLTRVHLTSRTANAELRRLIDQLRASPNAANNTQPAMPVGSSAPTPVTAPVASTTGRASAQISPASQKLVALDRLRRLGLIAALKEYFQHALAKNIALIFAAISFEPQALAIEMELFRIAQEAISNAIRHGQAKVIRISVGIAAGQVQLLVEDDGSGPLEHARGGVGLASMRERAMRLGGEMTLGSSVAGGVSVRVRVPAQYFN